MRISTGELVRMINDLPTNRAYRYVDSSNRGLILIDNVVRPNGPIYIRRYNPSQGGTPENARPTSISTQMIARIAGALIPNNPINFDRILGASYNTRSVLESLLAHTPQFYFCYPGRIDSFTHEVRSGHKHIMWCPNDPHPLGELHQKETDIEISELTSDIIYESLTVPNTESDTMIDINTQRQHARIQIYLILIGIKLGFKTWIAQNDRNIVYNEQRIIELQGVIQDMRNENILITSNANAIRSALMIDCIWFGNHRFMPAVMEVEHTTGVTSGLDRMMNFYNQIPSINTRYIIVAPDEDRAQVLNEINHEQYLPLNAKYMPYSAVQELFSLSRRRNLIGVDQRFIESFLETE